MTKGTAMWDDHENRYDMMNGSSGAVMGFGMLLLVLLLVALTAVVVHLYLRTGSGRGDASAPAARSEGEARRLLDRRLASGEITVDEYASVRTALEP